MRPVEPSNHQQNAVTWFTVGTGAFVTSMLLSGIWVIVALLSGFVALLVGLVEFKMYRKAKVAGKTRRKPKLKTRLKKRARDTLHGKPQGGKADYRRKHPRPPRSETTPMGNCSVRCRRSVNPVETCECVCQGKRHGAEA